MKFKDKEISKLSNDELLDAIHSVVGIDKNRLDQLDKSKKRHKKLFEAHPPIENPLFTQLANELNDEFKSRGLKGI